MGISLAILGEIERGNRYVDDQILNKISEVLDISISELMNISS